MRIQLVTRTFFSISFLFLCDCAIIQGLLIGIPLALLVLDTSPYLHPWTSLNLYPFRLRKALTRWLFQYMHPFGHSWYTRAPIFSHLVAIFSKAFHSCLKSFQCPFIFSAVFPPLLTLTICQGIILCTAVNAIQRHFHLLMRPVPC